MVYLYKKIVGKKTYYYLRASQRLGKRILTKDIAYLGTNLKEVRASLKKLPAKQIRAAYKNIQRFLESNTYLEKVKKLKIKRSPFLEQLLLEEIEACKLHWQQVFQKRNEKTCKDFIKKFIIDLAFNTTSIEGNTITLKEAQKLLIENLTPKDKTLREVYDIKNNENVFWAIYNKPPNLNHKNIIGLHSELMRDIDIRTGYRTSDIHVMNSKFKPTPFPYIKTDMNLLFEWYDKNKNSMNSFVVAAVLHHKFEQIHPFFDGNGRTGRMLLNMILLNMGYPPIIIRKRNRQIYLEVLRKADSCPLTQATPTSYEPLIEFLALELIASYWDSFL